jgi:hypothetical protein
MPLSPGTTARKRIGAFPSKSAAVAAALSPDGTRIAWLVTGSRSRLPIPVWIARLWPALWRYAAPRSIFALWVSRADGSDMREVGEEDASTAKRRPCSLAWTPDGKRLSYLYNDALYAVPAP